MSEPSLIRRERDALRDLRELTAERAKTESGLEATFAARRTALDRAAAKETARIEAEHSAAAAEARAELERLRAEVPARAEAKTGKVKAKFDAATRQIKQTHKEAREKAASDHEAARWEATTLLEAGKTGADRDLQARNMTLGSELATLERLDIELDAFLARGRMQSIAAADDGPGEAPRETEVEPLAALAEANRRAAEAVNAVLGLTLPRLIHGGLFYLLVIVIVLACLIGGIVALGPRTGATLGGIAGAGLATACCVLLYVTARGRVARAYPAASRAIRLADAAAERARAWIASEDHDRREQLRATHAGDVRRLEHRALQLTSTLDATRDAEVTRLESERNAAMEAIEEERATALDAAEKAGAERLAAIESAYREAKSAFETNDAAQRRAMDEDRDRQWSELIGRWRDGVSGWETAVAEVKGEADRLFLDWSGDGDANGRDDAWTPPAQAAPAMRFGALTVDRSLLAGGLPRDPRLQEAQGDLVAELPALWPFPEEKGSLVLRAREPEGRAAAVATLQAAMLRVLTSTPAGKVRFTIIDPVGLGQNFAAFMHLADYDEQLVTSRIWTEPQHIEKKLAELTEHMEKVIQKYLRNEYGSIQEYNAVAGEVAEPFRVLVVAHFPANFTEQAARRLVSIAQSGPKCGVFVLMSIDEREALPPGCTLADLEAPSTVLAWKEGRAQWADADFGPFRLALDAPPSDEALTRLLHRVGRAAKDANRVEVPFETVAPAPGDYWSESTAEGLDVPLGRVGATQFQNLRLGRGTSQHALLAGRTGSGKSSLLHALVTNAALRYDPDELELYLIDFKKGVEFKTYATHRLPHARVVAIESEREFGLSVLQKLDAEMKDRGDAFRAAGVQDLGGFRQARPGQPMPRVLLVVDEFQEFFIEDDKLAQEAALLLDRLVRQGRAFGIHALLGSQTLGGAFSLARSTLGQMAVRIALQCSESDAHLILSEDNAAARLLSRPGEAIYNDANGLLEGNHFFQVVWLPEDRREHYLEAIRDRVARGEDGDGKFAGRSQIVFEGNVPADLARNPSLQGALNGPAPTAIPKAASAWLGDAVAIKDPTAAVLRRQSGANVLIVGQDDEAALGVMIGAIASVAAQHPREGGRDGDGDGEAEGASLRVFVLDGTPDGASLDGVLDRLADTLPQPTRVKGWRDTAEVIGAIADEVERRQADRIDDAPTILLAIHDISRLRDLRKSDDDFGFGGYSSRGEGESKPAPSKRFAEILKDGPGVGVHVIAWCDSLNNLNRTLDRATLREFEMRVLFQMSPNDSSALIDSPAAGRLGGNRGLFVSEEEGRLEKFRPFGIPPEGWWEDVRRKLAAARPRSETNVGDG